jgi:hypothetical protein
MLRGTTRVNLALDDTLDFAFHHVCSVCFLRYTEVVVLNAALLDVLAETVQYYV